MFPRVLPRWSSNSDQVPCTRLRDSNGRRRVSDTTPFWSRLAIGSIPEELQYHKNANAWEIAEKSLIPGIIRQNDGIS